MWSCELVMNEKMEKVRRFYVKRNSLKVPKHCGLNELAPLILEGTVRAFKNIPVRKYNHSIMAGEHVASSPAESLHIAVRLKSHPSVTLGSRTPRRARA